MSRATARRLAWALFALTLALLAVSVAFDVVDRDVRREEDDSPLVGALFFFVILAFASVGALTAARRSENLIGWLFSGYGLTSAVAAAADDYATHALVADPGSLPGAPFAAWIASFVIDSPGVGFGVFAILLLLFPDGRPASPRWRPVVAAVVATIAVLQAVTVFDPGSLPAFPFVQNPLGVAFVRELQFLEVPLVLLLLALIAASGISLVRRFRRARGEDRQQLKWVVAAGAFLAATIVSAPVYWSGAVPERIGDVAWPVAFAVALATVPLACGFAILRYRLYEIDIIIRRTLVYAAVTATLAGAYLGLVLFLQLLSQPLTQGSDLAIAGSTLGVAALFRPVRRRIQEAVDRRFYRRRYDAERTLADFSARLREEVNLEALSADLRDAVRQTVQPAHVSLWLREARR
jgi:hypothetical protein